MSMGDGGVHAPADRSAPSDDKSDGKRSGQCDDRQYPGPGSVGSLPCFTRECDGRGCLVRGSHAHPTLLEVRFDLGDGHEVAVEDGGCQSCLHLGRAEDV
mmetsp:Transcript_60458/g.119793  ORF Transcript_60458/g.119793 Transcript_60458/m.119793 type:complete len:100 (-) Transcript_60458:1360-1659(-)